VVEDSVLLRYDAASLRNDSLTFRRKIMPSKRRVLYPETWHHIPRNRVRVYGYNHKVKVYAITGHEGPEVE